MSPPSSTLDRDQWFAVLERLAEALGDGPEVKLCLIGSAACIFGGMDGRTSRDLSDIRFLISRYHPPEENIRQIIASLSPRNREQAAENLIYLTAIQP